MALQSSGEISLAQVQSEFGGSNPIEMAEYYRNGSYVPSTISTVGSWSSWYGTLSNPVYYWVLDTNNSTATIYWNDSQIGNPSYSSTSYTTGGYDYEKGTEFDSIVSKYTSLYFYQVRRRTSGSTITVNSSVPTSGTISMSNFYGGRKT